MTNRPSNLPTTPSPVAEAARLRHEAETAEPERRAYLLWLAQEWQKSAEPKPKSAGL